MRRVIAAIVTAAILLSPATAFARPAASQFTVVVSVSPASMPYNAYPTLQAHTRIGSACSASVVYYGGRAPVSFDGATQHVGKSGIARWYWHEETKSGGGTATVTCTHNDQTVNGGADFTVY